MTDRRGQLRELYGIEFPDELFAFWDWHQALTGDAAAGFKALGLSLHGAPDVLAGKFDDRELRYPALLHWRYQYDPPELFTVMTGNTDGLHWGYWFDDPGRLPPVVASFYARDAFELTQHGSLFHALATHLAHHRRGNRENRKYDMAHAAEYDEELVAFDALRAALPRLVPAPVRTSTIMTDEGMGIVVPRDQVADWSVPTDGELAHAEILAFVEAEILAGRPGTALLVGKRLWDGNRLFAFDVLIRAYEALGREPLRAVATVHREHPSLPSLDILSYQRGDYSDLGEAAAQPTDVRRLEIHRSLETLDVDMSAFANLEVLQLGGNRLASLPASLARCTKLREINLYNNRFTEIPVALLALPALEELQLGMNPISHVPADLGTLRHLRTLDLSGSELSADDFARVRAALPTTKVRGTPLPVATPYSPKATFAVGDVVSHPTFGRGEVKALLPDGKIDVVFSQARKTLVHSRR